MNYGTVFQERSLGSVVFFMALGLALFHAPFIACAFYYYFANQSCTFNAIQGFAITFNLRVWLQVDAYTCIGFCIILLLLSLLSSLIFENANYLTAYTITATTFGVFRIIWLIVGAIMFWGYLCPKNLCETGFARYMWANLIIGFLGVILYYVFGYTYPRVTSVPVRVKVPNANITTNSTNAIIKSPNTTHNNVDSKQSPYVVNMNQFNFGGLNNRVMTPRTMNINKPPQIMNNIQPVIPVIQHYPQNVYYENQANSPRFGHPQYFPVTLQPNQNRMPLPYTNNILMWKY